MARNNLSSLPPDAIRRSRQLPLTPSYRQGIPDGGKDQDARSPIHQGIESQEEFPDHDGHRGRQADGQRSIAVSAPCPVSKGGKGNEQEKNRYRQQIGISNQEVEPDRAQDARVGGPATRSGQPGQQGNGHRRKCCQYFSVVEFHMIISLPFPCCDQCRLTPARPGPAEWGTGQTGHRPGRRRAACPGPGAFFPDRGYAGRYHPVSAQPSVSHRHRLCPDHRPGQEVHQSHRG